MSGTVSGATSGLGALSPTAAQTAALASTLGDNGANVLASGLSPTPDVTPGQTLQGIGDYISNNPMSAAMTALGIGLALATGGIGAIPAALAQAGVGQTSKGAFSLIGQILGFPSSLSDLFSGGGGQQQQLADLAAATAGMNAPGGLGAASLGDITSASGGSTNTTGGAVGPNLAGALGGGLGTANLGELGDITGTSGGAAGNGGAGQSGGGTGVGGGLLG